MKVNIETVLPISFNRLQAEIRRPEFFRYMAEPWLGLTPESPAFWPAEWIPITYIYKVNLFGRLKLGKQEFVFSEPGMPEERWAFRCKSKGAWIKLWDHWIILKDTGDGHTLYRDKITMQTGMMRRVYQAFAQRYTRYHQERLQGLVASGFTYPAYASETLESPRKHGGRSSSRRRSRAQARHPRPQEE